MRPLFRGEGCAINEAGISTAGNPLTRLLDATSQDGLHARQLRDGYLGGPRPPGGALFAGAMMDPMHKGGGLDAAWAEAGPMRPPMPGMGGPMLGGMMQDQLMNHMRPGPMQHEPGFFVDGPPGTDWAGEFARPGPQLARPPMGAVRPPGMEWAAEFQQGMPPPMAAEMEAAFRQAHAGPNPMEAAFQHAEMEAAFRESHLPPVQRNMEAAFRAASVPQGVAQAQMEDAFAQAQMEAAFNESQEHVKAAPTDAGDLAQAAEMVALLRNSGNPKFANSQFVSFIDKVSKGDLQFKDNTVVDREGNEVDWDALYDTAAATASDSEVKELDNLLGNIWEAGKSSSSTDAVDLLEAAWATGKGDAKGGKGAGGGLEAAWAASAEGSLEAIWAGGKGGAASADSGLAAAWASAGQAELEELLKSSGLDGMDEMEELWGAGMDNALATMRQSWGDVSHKNTDYKFAEENEYLDAADPLAEAQRLLREGKDREALLAFEAEVTRNPQNSEGWRQLGQLYAELDQDVEAIQCLRRGHEVDPYNLDSLLALGVSCTNELDQLPALRYLREWIENHEEHQVLVQGLDPPPPYMYEAWRKQVTQLFTQAAEANPLDADALVALGVMENINRNYTSAVKVFADACRLRPNDHTVWNKLGATLANSGQSEKAVMAYHQCLQLKPNYARSWSNLAIAHGNLGQHSDAARFFLSSLVLNPDAVHIWSFLHSSMLNVGGGPRGDVFNAIDLRDIPRAAEHIEGVLNPDALPPPSPELSQPADQILASMGL